MLSFTAPLLFGSFGYANPADNQFPYGDWYHILTTLVFVLGFFGLVGGAREYGLRVPPPHTRLPHSHVSAYGRLGGDHGHELRLQRQRRLLAPQHVVFQGPTALQTGNVGVAVLCEC